MSLDALKTKLRRIQATREITRRFAPAPCRHLAAPTGAYRPCSTCTGTVQVELVGCSLHGVCTESKLVTLPDGEPVRCCRTCPDRAPVTAPPSLGERPLTPPRELPAVLRRNLLFHLMPVPGRWQWHAARLRALAPLFDGTRAVAVAEGKGLDPVAAVRAALPGCEVFGVANDRALREVATFEALFVRLAAADDEVTLYAQSKGVTRPENSTCHKWAAALYATLGDWAAVEPVLRKYPLAGSFKKVGRGWKAAESLSDWHYSGSWFWFRNRELLSKPDWRTIDRFWSGIEPYPSLHFRSEDAGVVFLEGSVARLNLYDAGRWRDTIEPALAEWRRARRCT